MTQKVGKQIARPMDGAKERIDYFLRTQEEPFDGLTRYKRIDATDKKQLQELAERKLFSHLKDKPIHSFKTFIVHEIMMAKQYQNWFNKFTEKEEYYALEYYIDFLNDSFSSQKIERPQKIDWLKVYEEIDPVKPIQKKVYITNTDEQQKVYFSEASFNLTVQIIQKFKEDFSKNTNLLSIDKKILFLESKGSFEPQFPQTESGLFNQTVYEAKSNFSDFIIAFKNKLQMEKELLKTIPNFSTGWYTYGPEIYEKVKKLKSEFDAILDYSAKIEFFHKHGLSLECRVYPTTPDPEKQKLPENKLSIEPETPQQIALYNKEFFKWFKLYSPFGYNKRKEDFFFRVENGANKHLLIKNLIKEIETEYEKDKNSPLQIDFKLYSVGFEQSANFGDLEEEYFENPKLHNALAYFCRGFNDERFKRFLEKELKRLENPLPKTIDPLENLNKILGLYDVFIINCEISFQDDINDPRGIKIWKQCDELMGLDIDDITHRAFEESKKLMATSSNAENLLSTYLFESQSRTNRIDKLIEKYNLHHHINFSRFNYFHSTIGWLQNFRNKLQRLLNPEATITNWFDQEQAPEKINLNLDSDGNENVDSKDDVKEKVEQFFSFMTKQDNRKHKQIMSEIDLKNLVDWVTYFFENDFKIQKGITPIKNINTNKGNIIFSFIDLFDQLHPGKTRPDTLFTLIKKSIHKCSNDKIENFKKSKKPQYYDDLVGNR